MVTANNFWQNECLASQLFFTQYFYKKRNGRKFVVNQHHQIICDALDQVLQGKLTRLIINVAPRYSKTELAVKNFIARGLALNPSSKYIHLTYAAKLALDNSEETRDIVEHPDYQELFPNVKIKLDSKAKDKWYTTAGGGVYAAASGGQVTGFGAGKVDDPDKEELGRIQDAQMQDDRLKAAQEEDELNEFLQEFDRAVSEFNDMGKFGGAIIIDDPIKPEDAYSEIIRARINERFETTIRNRVNSRNTPIIIIQQRVHVNDLSGYLMEVEPNTWHVIKLPCLKDDGSALWPLKHTVEELQKLNLINGYVFQSQYQQDPQSIRKGGEAYKQFTKEKNVIQNRIIGGLPELYDKSIPLWVTFDFNVLPYIACTIHQIKGKRDIQIDQVILRHPRNEIKDVCQVINTKYADHTAGMTVCGDPSGRREDTRTERGQNDFTIITQHLKKFRPVLKVADKAPPVAIRIDFINAVFKTQFNGLEFLIGSNCIETIDDYLFGKEAEDRTKMKEMVTDPVTKQKYQKYHHITDANDYHYCKMFARDFEIFQHGSSGSGIKIGKPASRSSY